MGERFNKALIAPIVALALLILKLSTGFELTAEQANVVVNGILSIVAIAGTFMHPKK